MAFNTGPIDKNCPCKKACADRHAECHGSCERYREWRKKKDEELEQRNLLNVEPMSDAKKRAVWRKMRNSRQVRFNRMKDE